MKLAKELIGLMSDYYALNKLKFKMITPSNQEYMEILKSDVISRFLAPYGYIPGTSSFSDEIKLIPNDLLIRVDLVIKGAVFLYLNEILAWNEVKKLLNIGSTGVILYKKYIADSLGAYDIILSLLAVLFGKVNYATLTPVTYTFERLTDDIFYWNQPTYYYGYKAALSYSSIDDILDNIDWFLAENTDVQIDGVPNKYDILGMLRINNKFCKEIITQNELNPDIETEMDNLGLYNVSLNLIRLGSDSFGLGNVLFDFHKAMKETTVYSDDYINYQEIQWDIIKTYSKYIDTLDGLEESNCGEIEKIGNIIRNIQNFLIH